LYPEKLRNEGVGFYKREGIAKSWPYASELAPA
jgi:hypothetical protein